ncbi:Crp/Fnr family transcriptional regulator [Acidovorax sp. sif0715]|nr:Crp/Fnr family transcriptional regulator [Acidovorax sp. sif0732]MBV7451138.1 Crp/Fnr family transcriptional regulator [Acidovorax sp. sif0715]
MVDFLESSAWYRVLSPELQAVVLRTASERITVPGELVAHRGQPCTHWYGLVRGFLQMYVVASDGAETTLYCLREGEWGGEGSLLKKELRQYDLRSLTPAHLCLVPVETFETLRQSSIAFNHVICDIMNARMGVFVGMLEASRLRGPETRVARALLMLADSQGEAVQELLISQQELALICGLSRQRVNVALSVFKPRGIVRIEPNKGSLIVHVPLLRDHVTGIA